MSQAKKDDNNEGTNAEDPQGNAAEGIVYNQCICILGRLTWSVIWRFLNCAGASDIAIEDKRFALSLKSNGYALLN